MCNKTPTEKACTSNAKYSRYKPKFSTKSQLNIVGTLFYHSDKNQLQCYTIREKIAIGEWKCFSCTNTVTVKSHLPDGVVSKCICKFAPFNCDDVDATGTCAVNKGADERKIEEAAVGLDDDSPCAPLSPDRWLPTARWLTVFKWVKLLLDPLTGSHFPMTFYKNQPINMRSTHNSHMTNADKQLYIKIKNTDNLDILN